MNLLADLRQSFRQITTNRAFFAVAAVALDLGIGANTATFSETLGRHPNDPYTRNGALAPSDCWRAELLAAGLGGLLRMLLFGVKPMAPGISLAAAAAFMLVAMAAYVIPATPTSRGDPVVTLRNE